MVERIVDFTCSIQLNVAIIFIFVFSIPFNIMHVHFYFIIVMKTNSFSSQNIPCYV